MTITAIFIYMKYYSTLFLFALLFLISPKEVLAQTPADFNLTHISNLPYTQDLNDIWGYEDETGVEYALVGTRTGTSVVSLADPANPNEVLFIPGATSIWRDLKTWGDFAYVTTDQGSDGLLIIDLGPLPSGTPTYQFWRPELTFNNSTDTLNKAHNLYIDESGYCYIAGSNVSNGETFILDVHTTPGTPIFQSATLPIYAHDAYTRGDTLWTSDINDGTFSVYDVSNKTNLVFLANQNTPRDFTHNAWISDDGQALFTTDEKSNAWIGSYDVSDLGNITELDRWRTPTPNTIPHNVHTYNDFLVTSYYTDGLIILDASRPDNLVEVARYDTYNLQPETGFYGAWGAYPFTNSGRIYVSDINTGLHILQPNYQRACWLEGLVTDQLTGANLFDVTVTILNTPAQKATNLSGLYKTGYGISGTYDVEYKKVGYVPQTIQINLVNGQVTTQNVQLIPAVPFSISGQVVEHDDNSVGIPNAVVALSSDLYSYTVTADANGNFTLNIMPDGTYKAVAGKWGHKAKEFTFSGINASAVPPLVFPIRQGYKDEFVLDLGWTEFGDATFGKWERGIPEEIITWQGNVLPDEGDLMGDIGEHCLITGNNGNGTNGADDVDDGTTTIVSPVMDLTSYNEPKVTFHYFYSKPWPITPEDVFRVYMTNGTDTAVLATWNNGQYQWSSQQELDIKSAITLTNDMRVYFEVNDSTPGNIVEALVDLFEITDTTTTVAISNIPTTDIAVKYYPNPFNNTIQLEYSVDQPLGKDIPVQVFNPLGQIIEQRTITNREGTLQLGENWATGVYFVSIGQQTIRVIKQE